MTTIALGKIAIGHSVIQLIKPRQSRSKWTHDRMLVMRHSTSRRLQCESHYTQLNRLLGPRQLGSFHAMSGVFRCVASQRAASQWAEMARRSNSSESAFARTKLLSTFRLSRLHIVPGLSQLTLIIRYRTMLGEKHSTPPAARSTCGSIDTRSLTTTW